MNKLKFNIQMFAGEEDYTTKLADLIDPEVMAPMISAKIEKAIVATPFAKVDTTLVATPGSTITVPKYKYIGMAEDVAEGIAQGETVLETDSDNYTVKKAVKDVVLTDEAVLSGYGNPVGETNSQLGKSIADKVEQDIIDELQKATLIKNMSDDEISYDGVVDAIDLFEEEQNLDKIMFINPRQVTTLRKDKDFVDRTKYGNQVMMNGEIGMIANARVIPSRRIVAKNGSYACPIVQINTAEETQDETSAITVYLKRNTNVETDRIVKGKKTLISADKHYVVALTNESKVVIAKFKAPATSL
jgi:N4-gp56 family major capsid protein